MSRFSKSYLKAKLVGKKIYLRNIFEKDCNYKYLNWLKNKSVNEFLETRWLKQSIRLIKKYVSNINKSKNAHIFAIIDKKNNLHVGNIKIHEIDKFHKFAQIGYFIGEKKNMGKGFATEAIKLITEFAFKNLKLKYVYATVYEKNYGSIRSLKKNKYKINGRFLNKILFRNKRGNQLSLAFFNRH